MIKNTRASETDETCVVPYTSFLLVLGGFGAGLIEEITRTAVVNFVWLGSSGRQEVKVVAFLPGIHQNHAVTNAL